MSEKYDKWAMFRNYMYNELKYKEIERKINH